MKKNMLWIALAALLVPIVGRAIWFYPGFSLRPKIATPDYAGFEVPQADIKTPNPNEEIALKGGVVVVDYVHENFFQLSEISALSEALAKRGARVELADDSTPLEYRLKYASAYIVISPSSSFDADEILAVQRFVANGGRLVVFTDATRGVIYSDFFSGSIYNFPDVDMVNPLLAAFDIRVNNDYLYNMTENESNFRNVQFGDFGKHELTVGLKQATFYGTHSVKTDSGLILFKGTESTFSSTTDAHNPAEGGAVLSADGNVAVFGDFTFLASPYNTVGDNATLIANIADYLLAGERTPTLANFPYIFSSKTIHVFPTSEVQMTAEVISALGRLQSGLRSINVNMEISADAPKEGDQLVIGTFTPSDDLLPFVKPFRLTLDDFSEFVEIPNIGNVGRSGNGILLFSAGENGNTLVMLADTIDDLTYLFDYVSSGDLSDCLLQGNIGVCSIGFGGGFSEEPGGDYVEDGTATGEPSGEATPAPESTPSG